MPDPEEDSPLANKLAEIYMEQAEALKESNRTNMQQHMMSLAPKEHFLSNDPRASLLSGLPKADAPENMKIRKIVFSKNEKFMLLVTRRWA